MNTRTGLSFRPKACLRCGGDAYLSRDNENEWVCLQCGRVVPDQRAVLTMERRAVVDEMAAATGRREAA